MDYDASKKSGQKILVGTKAFGPWMIVQIGRKQRNKTDIVAKEKMEGQKHIFSVLRGLLTG